MQYHVILLHVSWLTYFSSHSLIFLTIFTVLCCKISKFVLLVSFFFCTHQISLRDQYSGTVAWRLIWWVVFLYTRPRSPWLGHLASVEWQGGSLITDNKKKGKEKNNMSVDEQKQKSLYIVYTSQPNSCRQHGLEFTVTYTARNFTTYTLF